MGDTDAHRRLAECRRALRARPPTSSGLASSESPPATCLRISVQASTSTIVGSGCILRVISMVTVHRLLPALAIRGGQAPIFPYNVDMNLDQRLRHGSPGFVRMLGHRNPGCATRPWALLYNAFGVKTSL